MTTYSEQSPRLEILSKHEKQEGDVMVLAPSLVPPVIGIASPPVSPGGSNRLRRPRKISDDIGVGEKRPAPSSSSSLAPPPTKRVRRTVTFASRVQTAEIMPFGNGDGLQGEAELDHSLLYTSPAELEAARSAVHHTVFLVRSGVGSMLSEEDGICLRGLEHWLSKDRETNRVRKSHGVVFAVQQYLRKPRDEAQGRRRHGHDLMARIYKHYSKESVETARKLAIKDAEEVSKDVDCNVEMER